MKKKIMLVTTVPETLHSILNGQPRSLAEHFEIMLVSSNAETLSKVACNEQVSFICVPMKRGISPLYDIYSIICMMLAIFRFRPNIIHSYTPKAGLVAVCAGFLTRVPQRLHTFTGLIFPTATGLKKSILIMVDKLICHLCTKVLPEGQGVRRDLIQYGVCAHPASVLGFGNIAGVDFSYFNPHLEILKEQADHLAQVWRENGYFIFCFIGRLNRDKGIAELLTAFLLLNRIQRVKLLVLGELDSESPIQGDDFEMIKTHHDIEYFGYKSDIRPYLLACDVHVLPSYREGFPNVVLQAGAMGRPSIVTDINGSNEIIENGNNGFLVPPKNSEKLFFAMQLMVQLPNSKLNEMGQAARENVMNKFERNQYLKLLKSLYSTL